MNYIENIFVCLAAPLIVAVVCMRGKARRMMLFLTFGMVACLLSSYISSFLAMIQGADPKAASVEISPLVEEIIKFFPVIFYLEIFEPDAGDAADGAMMTAVGFATFENVCFLMNNGADSILHLFIRGFATGTMHVVCAFLTAIGLFRLWNRAWLRAAGLVALLAIAITYHGIFNILVSQSGASATVGYAIPILTAVVCIVLRNKLLKKYF